MNAPKEKFKRGFLMGRRNDEVRVVERGKASWWLLLCCLVAVFSELCPRSRPLTHFTQTGRSFRLSKVLGSRALPKCKK